MDSAPSYDGEERSFPVYRHRFPLPTFSETEPNSNALPYSENGGVVIAPSCTSSEESSHYFYQGTQDFEEQNFSARQAIDHEVCTMDNFPSVDTVQKSDLYTDVRNSPSFGIGVPDIEAAEYMREREWFNGEMPSVTKVLSMEAEHLPRLSQSAMKWNKKICEEETLRKTRRKFENRRAQLGWFKLPLREQEDREIEAFGHPAHAWVRNERIEFSCLGKGVWETAMKGCCENIRALRDP